MKKLKPTEMCIDEKDISGFLMMILPFTAMAGEWQSWEEVTGQKVEEFQRQEEPKLAEGKYAWTWDDTMFEATLYGLSWIDMFQTMQFRRQGVEELNPFLGRTPNNTRIIAANVVGLAAHTYIAVKLPKYVDITWNDKPLRLPCRVIWQGIWIGIEADAVASNYSAGFRLRW